MEKLSQKWKDSYHCEIKGKLYHDCDETHLFRLLPYFLGAINMALPENAYKQDENGDYELNETSLRKILVECLEKIRQENPEALRTLCHLMTMGYFSNRR